MKNEAYTREIYAHLEKYQSRWGDMDGLRHLNHAVYLTLMETARVDFYASVGLSISKWNAEQSSILVSMQVDYFQQVHHPAILEIGQRIIRVGVTSFDILTGIFKEDSDEPVAQAVFTMVSFDYARNKPIQVHELIKKQLKPLP